MIQYGPIIFMCFGKYLIAIFCDYMCTYGFSVICRLYKCTVGRSLIFIPFNRFASCISFALFPILVFLHMHALFRAKLINSGVSYGIFAFNDMLTVGIISRVHVISNGNHTESRAHTLEEATIERIYSCSCEHLCVY